jgi:hypothetical protein
MKTIKTKKRAGKAYVLSYTLNDGKKISNSSMDKDALETLKASGLVGDKCSEIAEVELFETVEEQVADVGVAWVFFYKLEGKINPILCYDEWAATACRKRYVEHSFECSALRGIKEEF